jgi:hypothetical protein
MAIITDGVLDDENAYVPLRNNSDASLYHAMSRKAVGERKIPCSDNLFAMELTDIPASIVTVFVVVFVSSTGRVAFQNHTEKITMTRMNN